MNKIIHFEGIIETLQPYASATPSLTSSVRSGQPMPITRIFSNGEHHLSINAATIKGTLRRAAADVAFLYEQEKSSLEKPLSLKSHKLNRIGGSKGKGDTDRLSPSDYENINSQHLIVGLFGAGDPFVAGNISVNHAISSHNSPVIIDGVRSDDFLRDPNMLSVLDEINLKEFMEQTSDISEASKLKKERKELVIQLMNAATPAEKDKAKKLIDALDKKLATFKSISTQMPLAGFEAIPQGESLSHSMRVIVKKNLIQLGFLLEALDYLAFNPFMGGKKGMGCGEFKMTYKVYMSAFKQPKIEVGSVEIVPFVGLEVFGDLLLDAQAQYQEAKKNQILDFNELN